MKQKKYNEWNERLFFLNYYIYKEEIRYCVFYSRPDQRICGVGPEQFSHVSLLAASSCTKSSQDLQAYVVP